MPIKHSNSVISFPNCKINIGLKVLEKRDDGFHNIESVLYPINWFDAVEVIQSSDFSFQTDGISLDASIENNLCVKAFRLLQMHYQIPNVKMFLLKNIPSGAGLGGGSADAAFTLKLLNDFFELKLSVTQLKSYASGLGSDCAFFVDNMPSLVIEKGDVMFPVDLNLSKYHFCIVQPNIHINTEWAYNQIDSIIRSNSSDFSLRNISSVPIEKWNEFVINDFEEVVFKQHPQIAEIKNQLYNSGALYASMSGSGSSVFGIFKAEPNTSVFPASHKIYKSIL